MTFRGDERKATQTGDSTFAYDFAKFWRRVARVTAHLQSTWGVQPGDRVAWLGFNHELQLVTLVACARLGAVFLPLNFRLGRARVAAGHARRHAAPAGARQPPCRYSAVRCKARTCSTRTTTA